MTIKRFYNVVNAKARFPEPLREFYVWLGIDGQEYFEGLGFDEMEAVGLSVGLEPLGGSPHYKGARFSWYCKHSSEGVNEGQVFVGTGENYKQAALHALFAAWELKTRRLGRG